MTLNKESVNDSESFEHQNKTTYGSSTFISMKQIRANMAKEKESITSHGFNKLKALDESIQNDSKQNLYLGPKAIY